MKKIFITSTGTEIGKTFIASKICKELTNNDKKSLCLKPVITGFDDKNIEADNDIYQLLQAQNLPLTKENINKISLYRFKEPISPDIAARRENNTIDFNKLTNFCNSHLNNNDYDYCIIEGIGGCAVPLTEKENTLDLIHALYNVNDMDIILVAGLYLGSISHTLSAISAIESRGLKILSIIINQLPNHVINTGSTLDETIQSISNFTDCKIITTDTIDRKSF